MITEHVSVPRDELEMLRKALHRSAPIPEIVRTYSDAEKFHRDAYALVLAIISRATPSDVVRIGGIDSGEHTECLCLKCVARYGNETSATHYLPSVPRVVTTDAVNAACLAYNDSIEKTHDGFDLPWCDEDAMRAALESFATSPLESSK